MYATVKRMASISAILCVLNIFAIIIFIMGANALEIPNYSLKLGMLIYLFSSALISLLLTLALRSLCQSLELDTEGHTRKEREITEKIKDIEKKI